MPTQTRNLKVPYPVDNNLNVFGDYDWLHCNLTRDLEKPLEVREEWVLIGDRGCLDLDKEGAFEALKTLFFQRARL
jgi:hypothetical protein